MKNISKKATIILFLVCLILAYLMITNFVETKKIYPEEREWFDLNIWAYADNNSCLDLGHASVYYFNDPKRIYKYPLYKENITTKNAVQLDLNIRRICDFGNLNITISAKDLIFPIATEDNNNTFTINILNESKFEVSLDDNETIWYHRIELFLPIDNDFFNYYRFSSPRIPLHVVTIHYREGIFEKGYYADESSFSVLNSMNPYESRPIKSDRYKWYLFEDETNLLLLFNPKSKGWFLFQKMLDAIVLSLIAVLLYELILISNKKLKN